MPNAQLKPLELAPVGATNHYEATVCHCRQRTIALCSPSNMTSPHSNVIIPCVSCGQQDGMGEALKGKPEPCLPHNSPCVTPR